MFNNSSEKNLQVLVDELEKKSLNPDKLSKLLVSKNIKINAYLNEKEKTTILHKMIKNNKILSVQWLLEHDANPYIEDIDNVPVFFTFIESKHSMELFKIFVKHHIDFNYKNSFGRSVLQDLVLVGNISLYKKVIQKIRNPFAIDHYGKNILFDALSCGNKEMIELVYSLKDVDLNIQNKEKDSLLHYMKDGSLDILEFLLNKGVSPILQDIAGKNIIFYLSERMESSELESEVTHISRLIEIALRSKDAIEQKNKEGETLLLAFLKNLQKPLNKYSQKRLLYKLIGTFIDNGIDIDAVDDEGNSPLLVAVEKNDLDTVSVLVENGANINIRNAEFSTPLSLAIMKGNKIYFDMVKLLLAYGADPNIEDRRGLTLIEKMLYILIYAYSFEKTDIPFELSSAFHEEEDYIAQFNKDDYMKNILELMISNEVADLKRLDSRGDPYFFILIITENDSIAKMLFKYGADINQVNKDNENILQYYLKSAAQNQVDSHILNKRVKDIIKLGINLDYRDENGGTILHNAVLNHPLEVTQNMHHCGAPINVSDYKGRTLLHNAIWVDRLDTIKYIIRNDKSLVNTPDSLGVLPINYAAFMGNKEIVTYLIKEKAFVNNTHEKPAFMLNFLKRFHKNIHKLENDKSLTPEEKKDIAILIENMKREFNIVD